MAALNASGQIQLNGEAGDDTFNVTDTMAVAAETIGIDGGTGTDSLLLSGTTNPVIFDTFTSVERYQDNTDQAVTFTVVSGYADAMAITTINVTGVTTFTTSAASATVNLSNLTFSGAAFGAVTQLVLNTTGNGTTFLTGAATQATTITGGTGVDTIVGGTGADAITGGTGADIMTGGTTTANTFIFAAGASGLPSATVFDTITDFSAVAANVISVGAQLVLASTVASSAGTAGLGAANGVAATFNAADTTFAQHLAAVELGIRATTNATWETAQWVEAATDTYIFISDGVDGVGANDILIKLTGITGTNTAFDVLTLAGQTITLA